MVLARVARCPHLLIACRAAQAARIVVFCCSGWTVAALTDVVMAQPDAQAAPSTLPALVDYRWLHAHPELSGQERETSRYLERRLRSLGARVQRVGGHGLLATLTGAAAPNGPTVMYRVDMDALPIHERTGVPYASRKPGVMHACGHDLHMAIGLEVVRRLSTTRRTWSGTLMFVAQPAEETGEGAYEILADPTWARALGAVSKPTLVVAVHNSADLPAGDVALSGGAITANVDDVNITLHGRGGHGAKPHEAVDPIVMASEVVLQLQTVVSRRLPPGTPAVVTVGQLHAGTKRNIIPASAMLELTVRSRDDRTRETILDEIRLIASSVAQSYHAPRPATVEVMGRSVPSVVNDGQWSERLTRRFEQMLGKDHVHPIASVMVGEDFGLFGRSLGIPSVMWRVGGVNPKQFHQTPLTALPSNHSDGYAPDAEAALTPAADTVVAALLEVLSPTSLSVTAQP